MTKTDHATLIFEDCFLVEEVEYDPTRFGAHVWRVWISGNNDDRKGWAKWARSRGASFTSARRKIKVRGLAIEVIVGTAYGLQPCPDAVRTDLHHRL